MMIKICKNCSQIFHEMIWELIQDDGLHPLSTELPSGEKFKRTEYENGVNAGKISWQHKLIELLEEIRDEAGE